MARPKWWPYRSSKWFEMMMLEAALRLHVFNVECPWCALFINEDFPSLPPGCQACPMEGLTLDKNGLRRCGQVRFASIYGLSWRAAYPELVPPWNHEYTIDLVNENRWKYDPDMSDEL